MGMFINFAYFYWYYNISRYCQDKKNKDTKGVDFSFNFNQSSATTIMAALTGNFSPRNKSGKSKSLPCRLKISADFY